MATDPVFTRDVFVEPRLTDQAALAHATVANCSLASLDATVDFTVSPAAEPDRVIARKTVHAVLQPGETLLSERVAIPNPIAWSPEGPHLYACRVAIAARERLVDAVSARFGMREFTIRDGYFQLNGKRIFIKGAFWEGFYPSTLAHPRDPEIVRKEIRLAKEAGFNLLRPWRMPPVPMTLDLADEMGILLMGSPPIENMGYWPAETPQLEQRWTREMEQLVYRDRNHPALICWETANEIIRKSELLPRHKVSLAARRLDPTRVIIDESGGSRAPWGAHAYLPYSSTPLPIDDRHIYLRSPMNQADYQRLADYGAEDKLVFVSEVGYGGLPDLAENVARYRREGNPKTPDYRYHERLLASLESLLDRHQLRELFPDVAALCRATQHLQATGNKMQLEALRLNPRAGGYCEHAFTDGDWVLGAGVLDLWREPKQMFYSAQEVNRPLYLAVRATPQNIYAERGATLRVTAVNDARDTEGRLALVLTDPAGHNLWQIDREVQIRPGIQRLVEETLPTAKLSGPYTITARLSAKGRVQSENTYPVLVLGNSELKSPVAEVSVVDFKDSLAAFFKRHDVACRRFQVGQPIGGPVVVALPDAWNEQDLERFVYLVDYVKRGGVAIWLKPPAQVEVHGQSIYRDYEQNYMLRLSGPPRPRENRNWLRETGVFPWSLRSRNAAGTWICVGHYVRRHAIFAGLPTGGLMGQAYQNVAARQTLLGLEEPAVGGSISWDIQYDYRGPTEAWHGVDLAVIPHGKGKMILSTLLIAENLGQDPVADRLLFNLVEYGKSSLQPLDPASSDLKLKVQRYAEAYRTLRSQ